MFQIIFPYFHRRYAVGLPRLHRRRRRSENRQLRDKESSRDSLVARAAAMLRQAYALVGQFLFTIRTSWPIAEVPNIAAFLSTWGLHIHCMLFFLNGRYYNVSKRITRTRMVFNKTTQGPGTQYTIIGCPKVLLQSCQHPKKTVRYPDEEFPTLKSIKLLMYRKHYWQSLHQG